MKIYIPTIGRTMRQRTVERIPAVAHRKYETTLVCPPDEVKELRSTVRSYPVEVIGCKAKGISATRQWILDQGDDLVLMLDDDLPTWCQREKVVNENGDAKYHKASDAEIVAGLADFEKSMKGLAHGSIGHRLFCQRHPELYYNTRMLRALAYRPAMVREARAKFRTPVMEDFDMALQLLVQGYKCMVYNRLVQDQYSSNVNGGCSLYRTAQVQADAAHNLARRWPDFVTVVTRAPKREWGEGMGGERVDVKVNWRAAAKRGGL